MSLRTSLEAVLRKHKITQPISYHSAYGHSGGRDCPECQKASQLLDDLLACVPQPSREGLEKILVTHAGRINIPGIPLRELTDHLMAWMTRQTERVWCEHIRWLNGDWMMSRSWKTAGSATWCVNEYESFCRYCAAPRPGDG